MKGRWGIGEEGENSLAATQLFQIRCGRRSPAATYRMSCRHPWGRHVAIFADTDDGGIIAAADAWQIYETNPGIETVRIIAATRRGLDMANFTEMAAW
jgi:hypothetical protein